jgi:FAD/FMN-containing dehydrogenase
MKEQMEGLSTDQLTGLRRVLNCPILTPNDPDYATARKIWNGMIDRKPSVIVRPTGIADVIQVVRFARENGLAASVAAAATALPASPSPTAP